ncbi:MAG: histidine phosphatase family protein [Clostridia bacterium]|nr:histidine phosphatase family protein [Clostridia bacterium]
MKIIYVHHGNRQVGNPPTQNDDLTPLGYEDCNLVAELLNNEKTKQHIKAIYTSPFFRCHKTAEIINKHLNTQIINDDRLNEFQSKNESWLDAQNRITDCLNHIINTYSNDDIIICVTSGVNVGAFICKAYNIKPSPNTPFLGIPSCSPIIFDFEKQTK